MHKLPEEFIHSLEGVEGFDKESFLTVHENKEEITSVRLNPIKTENGNNHLLIGDPGNLQVLSKINRVPWSQFGYYLDKRPSFTFDPLFHAGCYYVQEASSMFLEQALRQLTDLVQPLRVLDLCGAPGGKSTHIQSLISPESLLVSNEVIRSRSNILTDNIIKWGCENVVVTNNDPSVFRKLEGFFDIIVVDAPCSGSGLFRRDEDATGEWSLNNVQLCSQRQKRILADALPALKQGGLLVYSTCSYSREEDEDIADWLVHEQDLQNEALKIDEQWGIIDSCSPATNSVGYRFYPDKLKGEGFFLTCFRKQNGQKEVKARPAKREKIPSVGKEIIGSWLNQNVELVKHRDAYCAMKKEIINDFALLNETLNITYAGTEIGQIMKNKLVPHHALAMSTLVSASVLRFELNYEQAISYLQKKELDIQPSEKGWQLVSYLKHDLGWINVLSNRINNYYPKELRILKQ